MKGVYLTIILLFFLPAITYVTAQSESVNVTAWIEVVDLAKSQKIEIRGMIKNESDQEITLYHIMELTKSGNTGTAKHQQSGSFTVDPNRTKILGRSSFYKNNADTYQVVFQIRNDLGVIFTDSLYYPQRPAVTKKEVPEKVIPPVTEKTEDTKIAATKTKTTTTAPATTPPPASEKRLPPELEKLLTPKKDDKPIVSTKKSRTPVPVDVLEIDGLIIDETRSKIARDFYDLFYKKWIPPNGAKNFSIYIREEPSRGRGARVSLTLNEDRIFQNFVPPRYDALENVVNYAIRVTRARLSAKAKINDQLKEEDQMGSGI